METIDGGSVNSGTLALGTPVCVPEDDAWVYADGNAGAGNPVTLIVPGDTIAKECQIPITATGDNLTATLTTPASATVTGSRPDTSLEAEVTATYVGTAGPLPGVITSANDGETVTATIEVEFPFGDATEINANDMQAILASLTDITVTLTQTES